LAPCSKKGWENGIQKRDQKNNGKWIENRHQNGSFLHAKIMLKYHTVVEKQGFGVSQKI
jgi:hypothetical protein